MGLLKHHFSGTIDYNIFFRYSSNSLTPLSFFYVSYIIGFTLFSFVQASHFLTAIFFHKIVTFFHFPSFAVIAFPLSLEEISFDDFIFSWNCSTQFNWACNTYSRLLLVELSLTGHFCWLVEFFILFYFLMPLFSFSALS